MVNNQMLLNVFLLLIKWIKVPLSKVSPNLSKQSGGCLCSCFKHVMWHCEFLTVACLSGFVSTFHWNASKAKTFELSAQVVNLKVHVFCNNCPSMFSHLITSFCPHGITNKMIWQLFSIEKNLHSCSFESATTVCVVFVALSKLKHSSFVLCVCCHFHSMCHHFRTSCSAHIMTLASVLDIALSLLKWCVDFHMFCNALNVASQFFQKISINLLLTMLLLQHHDCCPQHSMIHCLCLSFDVIVNLIAPVFVIVCHCGLWWKGHPKCPKEHCLMTGILRSHLNDQHFPSNESMFGQNLTLAAVSMSFL